MLWVFAVRELRVSASATFNRFRFLSLRGLLTYNIDQLRELELDFNGEGVCDVDHWTNQLVVIRQEVVVQSLRVWIS